MTTAINLSSHTDGDIFILALAGEANHGNTDDTFAEVQGKIQFSQCKKVLLDLRKITYCNSAFLGHITVLVDELQSVD